MSNKNLREHVPSVIKLLKLYVSINRLLPSVITEIVFNSNRDMGCRLLERCARDITDSQHAPKIMSAVKLVKMCIENKIYTGLEYSSDVPASLKDQMHRSKLIISFDGDLTCEDCKCKAGGKIEDNDTNSEGNEDVINMVCVHALPTLIKLSSLLYDYLADDTCFELSSLMRQHESVLACSVG